MSIYHDEVEIEDMEYDEETETYYYPCPCGDRFEITKEELQSGEDVAKCPSCSLMLKVIYDISMFDSTLTGMAYKDRVSVSEMTQGDEYSDISDMNSLNTESLSSTAVTAASSVTSNTKESTRHRSKGDNSSSFGKSDHQSDCQGLGAELGLTPSLLDEVLAEKKMGLMRSPEVMKFLQTQQAQLAKEKKMTFPPASNTDRTGKS